MAIKVDLIQIAKSKIDGGIKKITIRLKLEAINYQKIKIKVTPIAYAKFIRLCPKIAIKNIP